MRVKFPATVQFMRLGYEYQSLKDADIHPETRIFLNRFVPAIQRINSDKNLTVEQILATIEEIHGIIKNNDMGKEFLGRLLDQTADIKLIDFDHPEDNDFAVVDELTFGPEAKGSFRPDINILVNGIPLGFLEVKKPNNEGGIQKEFHRMLDERLQVPEFKKYFNMLQFVTFSNNMEYETDNDAAPAEEVRAGSFYSTPNGNRTFFSFFREENPKTSGFKEIYMDEVRYILKDNGYSPSYADTEEFQTNLQSSTPCNRFVTSFFDIPRMMYLLQYGFFYVDTIDEKTGQPVTQKHIMRYPQFFASQAILKRIDGGGKSGIIFHTQGSGKTELSAELFRFVKGRIPTEVFDTNDGNNLIPYLTIEAVNAVPTSYCKKQGMITTAGDTIMVMDSAASSETYVGHYGALGSTFAKLEKVNGRVTDSFVYVIMQKYQSVFKKVNTGSTVPHANKDYISKFKVVLPQDDCLKNMAIKFDTWVQKQIQVREENAELTSLRDFLLPMLMNGQVKVKGRDI